MQSIQKLVSARGISVTKLLAAIAISTIAGAGVSKASLISPGSSFDISIWGFTGPGGTGASEIVVGPITGTFGSTNNYTGKVLGSTQVTPVSSAVSRTAHSKGDSPVAVSRPACNAPAL